MARTVEVVNFPANFTGRPRAARTPESGGAAREASGYRGGSGSPIGLGGAIAVHALAVGLFLLIPKEVYAPFVPTILIGRPVPADPPPPEVKPDTPPKVDIQPTVDRTTVPDTLIPVPIGDTLPRVPDTPFVPVPGDGGTGIVIPADPPPPHDPVLVDARIDSRALPTFQPSYPAAMIRLGEEGKVTVRVTIDVDGRVRAIERVAATNDAFWEATERHAMKSWRFRPATRDGEPVVTTKVMTVYFKLDDR